MHIDIDTKFVMLIGTPLHQSFAARMQNAGYAAAGLNMHYFYCQADSSHLREILEGLRYTPAFIGAAITRPNKVAVLSCLDALDPLCEKMGACNTVVKDASDRLIGYNTDGVGFYTSLAKDGGFEAAGKTFFCLGAGGAGRSICAALADNGAKEIFVTDVNGESAAALVADINKHFAPVAQAVRFGDFAKVPACDCVINATGIGMGRAVGLTPLPPEYISAGQFYFDACYNPEKTQFLLNAQERGCQILNGLGMSLYQGAAQIKLWTGQDAPLDVMRHELETIVDELNRAHRLADAPATTRAALEAMESMAHDAAHNGSLEEGGRL